MKKTKWLDRTLFISPIYFCLCVTEAEFHKELDRLNLNRNEWPKFVKHSHSDATTHFFIHGETGKHCAIICMPIRDDKPQTHVAALIVHEAMHIWQDIKELIGEHSPSSEFEAYAVQSICQELFDSYAEKVGR